MTAENICDMMTQFTKQVSSSLTRWELRHDRGFELDFCIAQSLLCYVWRCNGTGRWYKIQPCGKLCQWSRECTKCTLWTDQSIVMQGKLEVEKWLERPPRIARGLFYPRAFIARGLFSNCPLSHFITAFAIKLILNCASTKIWLPISKFDNFSQEMNNPWKILFSHLNCWWWW